MKFLRIIKADWKTLVGFLVLCAIALGASYHFNSPSIFGIALLTLLFLRFMASVYGSDVSKTAKYTDFTGKVCLVIPIYNEDPEEIRASLTSIAAQTRLPEELYVVDDASTDPAGFETVLSFRQVFEDLGVNYYPVQQKVNRGKRHALGVAFSQSDADIFLGVDSDTVLDKDAFYYLLKPFTDKRVSGATGVTLAQNANKNLLTRLIDVRYAAAMFSERSSYTTFGAVLCITGSLAAYRGEIVRENLDHFLNQTFLGKPAIYGDDRQQTIYALRKGRVVLVEEAFAYTLVPERMSHFIKQQARWGRSFLRCSIETLSTFKPSHLAWLLTFVEVSVWLLMTVALISAVFIAPIVTAQWGLLISYLVFTSIIAYARNIRYFKSPSRKDRYINFLVAPLYGFMHVFLLIPIRVYAMLTPTKGTWGTREQVEVLHSSSQETPDGGKLKAHRMSGLTTPYIRYINR